MGDICINWWRGWWCWWGRLRVLSPCVVTFFTLFRMWLTPRVRLNVFTSERAIASKGDILMKQTDWWSKASQNHMKLAHVEAKVKVLALDDMGREKFNRLSCVRWCFFRWSLRPNRFPHTEHEYGRKPVWILYFVVIIVVVVYSERGETKKK